MQGLIKEIDQISIYLIEKAERVNEVALLQPLMRNSHLNDEIRPPAARKLTYNSSIPFFNRMVLKVQSFLLKHIPALISKERVTPEAKFKTVLAILLAQETVRDYFLSERKRRENFLIALQEAARACDYSTFTPFSSLEYENTPLTISRALTHIEGKRVSLIDDLKELNLQIAALKYSERSEILFRILNQVERPPITSVIEITSNQETQAISLTTKYAKYKITDYNKSNGKVSYSFDENRATSSIRTLHNSRPDAKGAMNQRIVINTEGGEWISSYCGELSTPFHVMEQILFILGQKGEEVYVLPSPPAKKENIISKKILFTSLYSWHELGLITDQRAAIQKWDQKIMKCGDIYYRLDLLYFNIPFNAFNKFPTPGEIKATIRDINDEALIPIVLQCCESAGIDSEELRAIGKRLETLRGMPDSLFLEREKALLEEIDAFRDLKETLISQLSLKTELPVALVLKALISDKKPNGKALKGVDKLLYFDYIATYLGLLHNKNCENATDRCAVADAADKAQFTFRKIYQTPYLPGSESNEEQSLFKVLYSMYLVWEEPEINTALSTGFTGEKFYNNLLHKNPETTRYLVKWLKKHPEVHSRIN